MKLSKEREGELFIFIEVILWGSFPVLTVLTYKSLPPLVSLGISTLFSTIFFALLMLLRNKWHELKKVHVYKDILIATTLVVLFYILYYTALDHTSPGNASIIALTETFFSYLFFNVWKREHMSGVHIFGALFMILGAIIVLYPNTRSLNIGDFLILIGAATIPMGNFYQRKARKEVSSETIMFVRSIIASIMIFVVIGLLRIMIPFSELNKSMGFLIINGAIVLGLSKIFWLEAIHRINVAKAVSLNAGAPIITMILSLFLLHNAPTIWQMLAIIPMFFGVAMLSRKN